MISRIHLDFHIPQVNVIAENKEHVVELSIHVETRSCNKKQIIFTTWRTGVDLSKDGLRKQSFRY
jgi:hypothetical protein